MPNNIFMISGPSGSGQDSIIKGLKKYFSIERAITTTARKMRAGESQKNPYYFINKAEFKRKIAKNQFFEYAKEYNNNYYGITFKEINRLKKCDKVCLWKTEYKGVITAKKLMPGIIAILITAPLEILETRIRQREQDVDEKYFQERMKYTKKFLKHKHIYDYEVENIEGKLNKTTKKIADIIKKHQNL